MLPPVLKASGGLDEQMPGPLESIESLWSSCLSPTSFRRQMEGLVNQYESLHVLSRELIDGNPASVDNDLMDADGNVPNETSGWWIQKGDVSNETSSSLLQKDKAVELADLGVSILDDESKTSERSSFPLPADECNLDEALPQQLYKDDSNDQQLIALSPIPKLSQRISKAERMSMRSNESAYMSSAPATFAATSWDLSMGGLFTKWFDPGSNSQTLGKNKDSLTKDAPFPVVRFDLDDEEEYDSCTISPVSTYRLTWDATAFLFLLVELWITPFELVFLEYSDVPIAFDILSHSITGFFTMDILLNFITGFVEGNKTVMKRTRIFKEYIRFWFWIDIVATIPLELLLNAATGGAFSVARLGKASKVIKTLRYLKLLRIARLLRVAQKASSVASHFRFVDHVRNFLVPVGVVCFFSIFAHIHGCIWAFMQPDWVRVEDPGTALELYFESFWWAYTAITAGSVGYVGVRNVRTDSPGVYTLEMVIATERLFLGLVAILQTSAQALRFVDMARASNARTDILHFLRKNKVSFSTQIQVMFCLTETDKAVAAQKSFNAIAEEQLPQELRRNICAELWNSKLMTLGMLSEISTWHTDFATELSQLIREETLPSKAIVFNAGDPAVVAYHITEGELIVKHTPGGVPMPNFKTGMWVGENSLASSFLRCPATFVTACVTSLMAVRGANFEETLSKLGLTLRFQEFCGEELWRGLCGRCGSLGDHFSDTCHTVPEKRISKNSRFSKARMSVNFSKRAMPRMDLSSNNLATKEEARSLSRELQKYLHETDLFLLIADHLLDLEVYDLRDLEGLDINKLRDCLDRGLSSKQEDALSAPQIRTFRERQASNVQKALFQSVSRLHHLIFLSHYKVEAGTEAALLRTEIEHVIAKDPGSLGHRFEQPVFLDSEDLSNLEELKERVCHTHNLVLLLTKGVLTRPWCVIEILTAWREGVRVQPVIITKPGNDFEIPGESFYRRLRAGRLLDKEAVVDHGFTMEQVELAIRHVFRQIAVPYSPHKAQNIREAEVSKLMKNCLLKSDERLSVAPDMKHVSSINGAPSK